jgi:hypothetical protein
LEAVKACSNAELEPMLNDLLRLYLCSTLETNLSQLLVDNVITPEQVRP